MEMTNDIITVKPFKTLKIETFVDWDVDDVDDVKLDSEYLFEFDSDYLFKLNDILIENEYDWTFNCDEFLAWFDDYLSDFSGFCHTGFSIDYEFIY